MFYDTLLLICIEYGNMRNDVFVDTKFNKGYGIELKKCQTRKIFIYSMSETREGCHSYLDNENAYLR